MAINQILALVIIAVIAASLATALMGGKKVQWGANCLIGFVGAFLGNWIQLRMQLPVIVPLTINHVQYEFIWPLLGAFLFIFLLRFAHGSEM